MAIAMATVMSGTDPVSGAEVCWYECGSTEVKKSCTTGPNGMCYVFIDDGSYEADATAGEETSERSGCVDYNGAGAVVLEL